MVGPTHVFDDHAGLERTFEVASHDLPVATPQALHDLRINDLPGTGRFKHEGFELGVYGITPGHWHSYGSTPRIELLDVVAGERRVRSDENQGF